MNKRQRKLNRKKYLDLLRIKEKEEIQKIVDGLPEDLRFSDDDFDLPDNLEPEWDMTVGDYILKFIRFVFRNHAEFRHDCLPLYARFCPLLQLPPLGWILGIKIKKYEHK